MNAFTPSLGLSVRSADLTDPVELRMLDAFVAGQPDGSPFHRPAWSLAVEQGCGQRAHYLVAEDGQGLRGVLPLSEIRSRLFGSALVSTGFGVGGGIVGTGHEPLANAAVALATRLGISGLELRGGPVPSAWQSREGTYAGFVKDLPGSDGAILKAIPRKQRAEVRRAQTFGLGVRVGRSEQDLADHYRAYSQSVRNLGTPVFSRSLFKAMLEAFGEDADILTVSKDGRPVASVFSFYHDGCVYPYWGGGGVEARALRANDHIYYELMRHAAARGCTRFDFGRSKVGTGAFAYKKNWGFEPKPLIYATRTLSGATPRAINPLDPKYRLKVQLWQRLPLPIANLIGPWIARGLG
jgi:FemAB-related protein (PEP-CTERM system-associated)